MNRIEALSTVGQFLKSHHAEFACLPKDSDGRPSNIEIRKLLAVDMELSIALAGMLALIYWSMHADAEHEANNAFERRA